MKHPRVLGVLLLALAGAWPSAADAAAVPVGASDVYVQGKQVIVRKRQADGSLGEPRAYAAKGVAWAPATRAPAAGPNPLNPSQSVPYGFFFDWPGRIPQGHDVLRFWQQEAFKTHYPEDLALMETLHANTIRVYDEINSDPAVTRQVLDECYRRGIMVIMTVATSRTDLQAGRHLLVVNRYKDHPAILLWALGNEWNLNRYYDGWTMSQAIDATRVAAAAMKQQDPSHPVSGSLGDRFSGVPPACDPQDPCCQPPPADYAQTAIPFIVQAAPEVDLWGINVYRGASFGNLFAQWQAAAPKTPMYLSEFGTDALKTATFQAVNCGQADNVTGNQDQAAQSGVVTGLWQEIVPHLSAVNSQQPVLGGFVFGFNDQLWKVGSFHAGLGGLVDYDGPDNLPDTADDDTSYDEANPEGFAAFSGMDPVLNEEYFGLVNADRVPRQVFGALQQHYLSLLNAVLNPGFEAGTANWSFPANGSVVTTGAASGTRSARLVNAGTITSTPQVAVTSGKHVISGWVKTQGMTGSGSSGARIRVQWYASSGALLASQNVVSALRGTTGWTRHESTLAAPSGTATARLQLEIAGNSSGTAWFDALSLSP